MIRVLSTDDVAEWTAALDRMNYDVRDVHFLPGFAKTHERDGATAHLAVYQSEEGWSVIQPFLKRPVDGGRCDITSMGYGGPISDAPIPSRAHGIEYAAAWVEWMEANGVVCEFALLNPLFETEQGYLIHDADTRREKSVVFLPLDNEPAMIERMRHGRRQAIKKFKDRPDTFALLFEGQFGQRAFTELYGVTMVRNNAPPRWRLSAATLDAITALSDAVIIAAGSDHVGATSMAIILFGRVAAYYHLAANIDEFQTGANEAVILMAARMARQERGSRWLHLGGGRTNDPNDSLLDYKQSFGGITVPVYSYNRVIDTAAYLELCGVAKWTLPEKIAVAFKAGGFFPAYRAKEAT